MVCVVIESELSIIVKGQIDGAHCYDNKGSGKNGWSDVVRGRQWITECIILHTHK
jgi:hypothetical protein